MSDTTAPGFDVERQRRLARRVIERSSFCLLATASGANRPHVAGVMYAVTSEGLFVNTDADSIKARNVRENWHVGATIPVRRLPVGPPFTVQFQTTAELVLPDDPLARRLLVAGELKAVTSHGELDLPDPVFIRMRMPRRVATYGIGIPLLTFIRHPLEGGRSVVLDAA
jgi:hypothetical protein